ncbi:MAG: hypothetical protein IJZ34_04640 [Lachnospiraceae bacterium]|nr:hypothetical protein [Lachnospiraceae bacterium]
MKKLITKTLQKNESLFYFWRNYLLFTILFVGCIVPILLKTFWVLEDNVEKGTYRNVAEGMSVLDNEIMILNNVVIDMRSSRHFSSVRSMDEVRKGSDYAILNDMQEKLKDSTQFLSFAIEPMLYFSNGVMFFNDMTFAIEAQYLYKRFYEESHADLKSWMEELAAQEYTYALLPSESYFSSIYGEFDGIAYVHSYKLASHQESSSL